MEDIENYSEQIIKLMEQYEETVIKSLLYDQNRTKWKQTCLDKQRKIKKLILSMKQQIDESPAAIKKFSDLLKQHQSKLGAVIQQYQRKLKAPVKAQAIRKQIPKINSQQSYEKNKTIQFYFNRGDKEMARMEEAVQNMNAEIQQGCRLADQVNVELHRQIEQLGNIEDAVKDTKSTLKRADRTIAFFAKAAQCDKCILGLVIINVLALISFIVLLTKKK